MTMSDAYILDQLIKRAGGGKVYLPGYGWVDIQRKSLAEAIEELEALEENKRFEGEGG